MGRVMSSIFYGDGQDSVPLDPDSWDLKPGAMIPVVKGVPPRTIQKPACPTPDNVNPKVVIIGESPGKKEIATGVCFCGPTGKELTERLIPQVARIKSPIWLTNLSKLHQPKPTAASMREWHMDLMKELEDVKPDIILTLGRFATWAFLEGEPKMEEVHGMCWKVNTHYDHECILVPCYHPAAGFHNPTLMAQVVYDFDFAGRTWKEMTSMGTWPGGEYGILHSEGKYVLHTGPNTAKAYGFINSRYALDTESLPNGDPLCLSVTPVKGSAYWDEGVDGVVIPRVQRLFGETIIMHGALHDLKVLRQMGITLDKDTKVVDTMVMAHLLGTEPLGLKALGRRLCSMEMVSYVDTIAPAQESLAHAHFRRIEKHLSSIEIEENGIRLYKRVNCALKDKIKNPALDLVKRWKGYGKGIQMGWDMPQASLADLDPVDMVNYAGRDPHVTARVFAKLKDRITIEGLQKVFDQDMAIMPMLCEMECNGLTVDTKRLAELSKDVKMRIKSVEIEIQNYAVLACGHTITITNKDEVSQLLFNKGAVGNAFSGLGLPPGKLTGVKKRPSVAKQVLEGLKGKHPIIKSLLRHSELSKIDNTYLSKLPGFIKNGKIGPNISLIRVPSGRLALKAPNLLAIPVRSEYGRKVRECFVASPGYTLMSWDLDQIELRVLAHLSGDQALTRILSDESRHIHKETCAKIYGIPLDDVKKDSEQYMLTKNITFGIIYLISAGGLHSQLVERGLKISLEDCKAWIKEWYQMYPGVYKFQESVKSEARRTGHVTSMLGRYRLVPGVRSTKPSLVGDSIRQAVNHPVQTGAQEVLKAGMVKMWTIIRPYRQAIRPLLQIHDELLFEVEDGNSGWFKDFAETMIPMSMTSAMPLNVPIRVSMSEGSNWSKLK